MFLRRLFLLAIIYQSPTASQHADKTTSQTDHLLDSTELTPPAFHRRKPPTTFSSSNQISISPRFQLFPLKFKTEYITTPRTRQSGDKSLLDLDEPVKKTRVNLSISPFGLLQKNEESSFGRLYLAEKNKDTLLQRSLDAWEKEEMSVGHRKVLRQGETSNTPIKQLCNVTGGKYLCYSHGGSKCYCRGGLADCSGKPYRPNMAYAPRLPRGVKCLIFQYNHMQHFDDSYFYNVSSFHVIDFSYNDLQSVSLKTFEIFKGNLKYLILSYNIGLKYKYVQRVLAYPPSSRLDLINIGLKLNELPYDFFKPYSDIPTQEFHFDLNFSPLLDLNQFAHLKNVQFLSFKNSSITNVTSAFLPKLTGLNLENNAISHFPQTCRSGYNASDSSMFPKLEMFYLNTNNISQFPLKSKLCLPSVILLGLTRNDISSLTSYTLVNIPLLKVLYLDEMKSGITTIEPNALSSKSLISLHISRNNIRFLSSSISPRLFHNCSRLKVLSASHNNMANVSASFFMDFLSIPTLEYLYLSSCRIQSVPSEGLSQLKKLKKLYLYVNEIQRLPAAAFDSLISLQYLHLDRNLIEDVRSDVFSEATMEHLVEIDLSANSFQCTCDILWFKQWLLSAGSKQFANFPDRYTCANIPEKLVIDFSKARQACYFSRSTYIIFVVCLSIFLAGFLTFVILFKYRWHIRLALYEWKVKAAYDQLEDDVDYQYDVFIVYCNDDSAWVLDDLLFKIENHWGHRAFIHERDFQAGRFIIDNMVRAMNLSRRILVVLTSSFALSRWCNFELQLCQSHVIEHDLPSLLVLQLEPIRMRDMTEMLVALRNTTSFLEWPANQQDGPLFWRRLERCMDAMRGRRRRRQERRAEVQA